MAGSGLSQWQVLAMVGVVATISFFLVGFVEAQGCNPPCSSHAYCYTDHSWSTYFYACNGYRTGNGYNSKYSMWRLVLYILSSVIGLILIFFLCLSCLVYFRRQQQPVIYLIQPMGNLPYDYPPPPAQTQSSVNPAMYSYPPQTSILQCNTTQCKGT